MIILILLASTGLKEQRRDNLLLQAGAVGIQMCAPGNCKPLFLTRRKYSMRQLFLYHREQMFEENGKATPDVFETLGSGRLQKIPKWYLLPTHLRPT